MARSTTNIFYDFVGATGHLRNEPGKRFEEYTRLLLSRMLRGCQVRREFLYRDGTNSKASCDVLCFKSNDWPDLIIECKGVRMNFEAKFSANPLKAASSGYREIAHGVFQIWKYASRRRRLQLDAPQSVAGSIGIVLTLDSWLTMSAMRPQILRLAYEMAATDPQIDRRDDIPIIFCPIDDFEVLLHESDEISFFCTIIEAAYKKKYQGWLLPSIHNNIFNGINENNSFPFEDEIGELLPWWKVTKEIEQFSSL